MSCSCSLMVSVLSFSSSYAKHATHDSKFACTHEILTSPNIGYRYLMQFNVTYDPSQSVGSSAQVCRRRRTPDRGCAALETCCRARAGAWTTRDDPELQLIACIRQLMCSANVFCRQWHYHPDHSRLLHTAPLQHTSDGGSRAYPSRWRLWRILASNCTCQGSRPEA